jgi:2-phospho-L-lactate transferase/gluconeogenesis factor (CofD/UPF0052 family)
MKIVMFCGGRGATTIIEALVRQSECNLTLLINCYDNGLSTGKIRKYIKGLLGPSDFRKNLTTFLSALEQKHLANFLEFRISNLKNNFDSLEKELIELFNLNLEQINAKQWKRISESLSAFENYEKLNNEKFDYEDCAVGNLVIAGSFLMNNRDINKTFSVLCSDLLGENSKYSILNITDGSNLYLYAKSLDGQWVLSEEAIVDNPQNLRISEVFLAGSPIKDPAEVLDQSRRVLPEPNTYALKEIQMATAIVFGPGTPASSLFPTYITKGVAKAIATNHNAIKLFISNINPDRDDPKGTLQSRINGTLLHFNLVEKYELQQLINAVFMNADDQEAVDYIKNQNSNIRIIRDDWSNLKGKHLGPAVVRQLQKLTTTTFELKPGFVSVIIPVLDEIGTIVQILKLLNTELAALNYGYEIIIIDGGSSDGTVEAINKIKTDEVQILKSKFKGRGGACRTGIEKSKGDVIGIFHADLEYDLKGFVKCLELNLDGTSKATIGIRVSKTKNLKHQIQNVYVNQKLLGTLSYWGSIAVSTMALIKIHRFFLDPLSGIKIFNKSDIENITFHKNGLDFEIELLRHLTRRNVEILEIPIGYVPRSKKNGKKTTILKGLQALKYVSFMGRN